MCPFCGCKSHYGHGDLATCARCARFVSPETVAEPAPDTLDAAVAAVVRRAEQTGGRWVTTATLRNATEE